MGICAPLSESKAQTGFCTDWDERCHGTTKDQSYPAVELPVQFFLRWDLVGTKHEQFLKDEWDGYGKGEGPAKNSTNREIQDCQKRPLAILVARRYERL